MIRCLSVGVLVPTLCALAVAASNGDKSAAGTTLVEIDGVKLTLADLEAKRPGALFQARNTYYEAERKAVEEFISDYLLERQAQKENVTVPELLQRHVNGMLPKDPPEEALQVYYEGVDTKEPYAAVRVKILDAIRERRLAKAKADYLQSLRKEATIAVRLSPPRAPVALKNLPVRGPADAPVTLVEYADYECPACQQIQPALDKLEAEYKGRLAFVYKDAPLPMHPHAQKAAEAARCAGAQGKYWEYHDLLFASKQLEVPQLKADARAVKLNGEAFDKCLDSGAEAEAVRGQLAEAISLGIPGTPGLFINGRFLNPNSNINYEVLRKMVEEELRASSEPPKEAAGSRY